MALSGTTGAAVRYADDINAVVLTLRSVIRIAGAAPLRRHWLGTPEGLNVIVKLTHAGRHRS